MILKIQFTTQNNIQIIKKRIMEYLIKELFKLKHDNVKTLIFEKGSVFMNHFTFNPRKWKSKVKVNISRIDDKSLVWAKFDIDTIGQSVTEKEIQFWNNCVNRLEDAANGAFEMNQLNSSDGKSAFWYGWKVIGMMVLIIVSLIIIVFVTLKLFSFIF
jgi:hypothetical protein